VVAELIEEVAVWSKPETVVSAPGAGPMVIDVVVVATSSLESRVPLPFMSFQTFKVAKWLPVIPLLVVVAIITETEFKYSVVVVAKANFATAMSALDALAFWPEVINSVG